LHEGITEGIGTGYCTRKRRRDTMKYRPVRLTLDVRTNAPLSALKQKNSYAILYVSNKKDHWSFFVDKALAQVIVHGKDDVRRREEP
jgi:hypothetical protein